MSLLKKKPRVNQTAQLDKVKSSAAVFTDEYLIHVSSFTEVEESVWVSRDLLNWLKCSCIFSLVKGEHLTTEI